MSTAAALPPDADIKTHDLMAGTRVAVRRGDTITCSAGAAFRLHMGEDVACIDLTEFEKGMFDLPMTFKWDDK